MRYQIILSLKNQEKEITITNKVNNDVSKKQRKEKNHFIIFYFILAPLKKHLGLKSHIRENNV